MDLLTQLLLSIGAFSLLVVLGTFIFLMMYTTLDTIDEKRQARERGKKR